MSAGLPATYSSQEKAVQKQICHDERDVANVGCTLPLEGETLEDSGGGGGGEALLQNQWTVNGPDWLRSPKVRSSLKKSTKKQCKNVN